MPLLYECHHRGLFGTACLILLLLPLHAGLAQSLDPYEVVDAADEGDVETVQRFLTTETDSTLRAQVSAVALIRAADRGHVAVARLLLDAGASPNQLDEDNGSALLYAADAGHTDIVRLLLKAGADPNIQGRDEVTPLLLATEMGERDIVDALLQAGADPNLADGEGATPLLYALSRKTGTSGEIVALLREAGAKLTGQDRFGRTVLMFAAAQGQDDLVREILNAGADPNATEQREGMTALFAAASMGHVSTVRLLLDAGADPGIQDANGRTALDHAVEAGHDEVASLLRKARP